MTSSDRIKILYLIPSCKFGGVPINLLELVKRMDKKEFHIELVAPNDGIIFNKFAEVINVHNIRIRGFYPSSLFYIRRLIREEHFDIIHARGKGAGIYARLACFGHNSKIVYGYHGFHCSHYSKFKRIVYLIMEKLFLKWTDRIICVSEGEKKEALKAGVLTERKAIVLPNGINIEIFKSKKERKGYIIGTLSRISIQKGLEYLIQAVADLKKEYPNLICFIAGGTQKDEIVRERKLKNMVKTLKMEKIIKFIGEMSDVPSFLNKIDLYVSSSLWEGLPTAILEAFAAKVPVVATNVTGNDELVINGKTGLLVRPKDIQSLTQGIDFAFKHRDKMKQLSEKAFNLVNHKYSIKSMVDNHELLYRNLLKR